LHKVTFEKWKTWVKDNCPKKSSKGGFKHQRGGGLTATSITWFINVTMGLFMVYSLWNVPIGVGTTIAGFQAAINGECTSASNYIWSSLGLSNPICDTYQRILRIVDRALFSQDKSAIAQLLGYFVMIVKGPTYALHYKRKATYKLAEILHNAHPGIFEDDAIETLRLAVDNHPNPPAEVLADETEAVAALAAGESAGGESKN
jgi:hypothetical protein